jgi:hypothetical protein
MVSLVVASKRYKKNVNVIFMVNTTSHCLYLSENTMRVLGFGDPIPATFDLIFRGRTYEANVSPPKISDINIIGASFLRDSRAVLDIDYNDNCLSLSFK